jgi:signal transduction histidine kinase
MMEALNKGDLHEAKQLAADIRSNQEKIREHGNRAGSIVRSMLLHSRASNGLKESTDINKLCEEYLRLAYHGMRAKDKSFNVLLDTQFDPTLDNLEVIPQDIGRVLLNLFNNAFYAVHERAKSDGASYQPTIKVATSRSKGNTNIQLPQFVSITITDNGTGIPDSIRSKIFQPFFTTKPTGQGTGLGLSLSYDIVKAHGGELKVQSIDGEGTEFIILLTVI